MKATRSARTVARHAILPLVSDPQLEDEIAGSRRTLREKLGFEIQSFCYRMAITNERAVHAVERAGYRHAVTTRYGINRRSARRIWRRLDMQSSHARTAQVILRGARAVAVDGSVAERLLTRRRTSRIGSNHDNVAPSAGRG